MLELVVKGLVHTYKYGTGKEFAEYLQYRAVSFPNDHYHPYSLGVSRVIMQLTKNLEQCLYWYSDVSEEDM